MLKFLGKIISLAYSIGLFLVITVIIFAYCIFASISNGEFTSSLSSVDYDKIKLFEVGLNLDDYDKDDTLEDIIIDYLMELDIPKKDAKKILNDEPSKKIILDNLLEKSRSQIINNYDYDLKEDELKGILTDQGVSEESSNKIIRAIDEFNINDYLDIDKSSIILKYYDKYRENIIVVIGIIVLVVSFFILAFLNWNFSLSLVYLGFPVLISGLLYTLIGLLSNKIISFLSFIPVIGFIKLLKSVLLIFSTYGIYIGIIGIALVIIGKITNKN